MPLSVRATDPDGGALDVRFEGRKRGATVPAAGAGTPFTVVALPDTQNYTYNNRQGTIVQQAQWVVDTRASSTPRWSCSSATSSARRRTSPSGATPPRG